MSVLWIKVRCLCLLLRDTPIRSAQCLRQCITFTARIDYFFTLDKGKDRTMYQLLLVFDKKKNNVWEVFRLICLPQHLHLIEENMTQHELQHLKAARRQRL